MSQAVLIDEIMATAEGQELIRQHQEGKAEKHREMAQELGLVRAERGATLRPLNGELNRTLEAVEMAQATLRETEEKHRLAVSRVEQVKASFDARIRRIEGELIQIAPPEIDVCIQALRDEIEAMQKAGISNRREPTGRMLASGVDVMRHFNNSRSVERRMKAIQRAIAEAEKLKIKPPADLKATLDELVSSLPPLVMEEV